MSQGFQDTRPLVKLFDQPVDLRGLIVDLLPIVRIVVPLGVQLRQIFALLLDPRKVFEVMNLPPVAVAQTPAQVRRQISAMR